MDNNSGADEPSRSKETVAQAVQLAKQAEKLSQTRGEEEPEHVAVKAEFVTPHDPVIIAADGNRLPAVPVPEAIRLNELRKGLQKRQNNGGNEEISVRGDPVAVAMGITHDEKDKNHAPGETSTTPASDENRAYDRRDLGHQMPPSHTNPLFPPLPLYGPPSFLRTLQCLCFRVSAFFLSLAFLGAIVSASLVTNVPRFGKKVLYKITFRDIRKKRPFYEEECRRACVRQEQQKAWEHRVSAETIGGDQEGVADDYPPTEGGKDPIVCDVRYYARRVGLEVDEFHVRTEDGFLIDLWHVYDPREYVENDSQTQSSAAAKDSAPRKVLKSGSIKPKFPVLLMHGLLQSSGAYCCNDDESLAFWLCKSGFDVWLGNNRCGFNPRHEVLTYSDPRMWCWNIRQMGVFDLPALTTQVLSETGFDKLALICHSQGTTETLVALAKDQRPEFGEKLTVFCGLAPAAYAGPLIGRFYFKFMRNISPAMFRMIFGIHAFIPFMMQMHAILPPRLYGWLGYRVFSFLFSWSDDRWDRGLRNRLFQFAPVYVSAEAMRWWLGRDGFAKHKCILSTKDIAKDEARVDSLGPDEMLTASRNDGMPGSDQKPEFEEWYNSQAPPFAFWVCANDELVDGPRLLRRFDNGREPHINLIHRKVIENYEHLDVIWAMDAVDQVFKEIREVLWKTCNTRDRCRVPIGCEAVPAWVPENHAVADAVESRNPGSPTEKPEVKQGS